MKIIAVILIIVLALSAIAFLGNEKELIYPDKLDGTTAEKPLTDPPATDPPVTDPEPENPDQGENLANEAKEMAATAKTTADEAKIIADGANIVAGEAKTMVSEVKESVDNLEAGVYGSTYTEIADLSNPKIGYVRDDGKITASQGWRYFVIPADGVLSVSAVTYSIASNLFGVTFHISNIIDGTSLISGVKYDDSEYSGAFCRIFTDIAVPQEAKYIVVVTNIEGEVYAEDPPYSVTLAKKGLVSNVQDNTLRIDALEARDGVKTEKTYTGIACSNDFAFIGDELWTSRIRDGYTEIYRYKDLDGQRNCTYVNLYYDTEIHLNTMSYCENNDCLLFGNGGSTVTTEGNYIAIIKNPLALSGDVNLEDVALIIPVSSEYGFKVQAIWADENYGEYNAVWLISNYLDIRKIILEKDADGEFTGNFVVVETHNITGLGGMNGGCYYNGYLYLGGAAEYTYYVIDCSDWSSKKIYQNFYKSDGTKYAGTVQGIKFHDGYMWLNMNSSDSGERLVRRIV